MIIEIMSEGALLEEQARGEYIDWLVNKEFNYLRTLNDRQFKEWIKEMIEEEFAEFSSTDLETFITFWMENNNE